MVLVPEMGGTEPMSGGCLGNRDASAITANIVELAEGRWRTPLILSLYAGTLGESASCSQPLFRPGKKVIEQNHPQLCLQLSLDVRRGEEEMIRPYTQKSWAFCSW